MVMGMGKTYLLRNYVSPKLAEATLYNLYARIALYPRWNVDSEAEAEANAVAAHQRHQRERNYIFPIHDSFA